MCTPAECLCLQFLGVTSQRVTLLTQSPTGVAIRTQYQCGHTLMCTAEDVDFFPVLYSSCTRQKVLADSKCLCSPQRLLQPGEQRCCTRFTSEMWLQQVEKVCEYGRAETREACPQKKHVSFKPGVLCGFLFNPVSAFISSCAL